VLADKHKVSQTIHWACRNRGYLVFNRKCGRNHVYDVVLRDPQPAHARILAQHLADYETQRKKGLIKEEQPQSEPKTGIEAFADPIDMIRHKMGVTYQATEEIYVILKEHQNRLHLLEQRPTWGFRVPKDKLIRIGKIALWVIFALALVYLGMLIG
jgi:hypothetical protein